jgi:hypothetical protein
MCSTANAEGGESVQLRNAASGAEEPILMQCSPARPGSLASRDPAPPHSDGGSGEQPCTEPAEPAPLREYLCYFLHRLLDFRAPELVSLASLAGIPMRLVPPDLRPDVSPFWWCRLPSDDAARRLTQRSMLVKGIFEVYAEGATMDELVEATRALPPEVLAPHRHSSWKVTNGHRCSAQLAHQLHNCPVNRTGSGAKVVETDLGLCSPLYHPVPECRICAPS